MLKKRNILPAVIIILYIALNNFLLIKGYYWLLLLPFFMLVAWYIFLRPDSVILLIVLLTPLSVRYEIEGSGLSITVPNEPIIIGLMLLFFANIIIKGKYDKNIIRHPISIAIIINLLWILITALTSTMNIVSLKFFLSRLWFVTVFYFMTVELFKNFKYVKKYLWYFSSMLAIVVLYTLYNHSHTFFTQETANLAPKPFMNDHTVYAAILAITFPVMAGFAFASKDLEINKFLKYIAFIILVILSIGLVFSYTRAAWISLLVAGIFFIILLLRIRYRTIVIIIGVIAVITFFSWSKIYTSLTTHEQKISSTKFDEHIKSISNITTDLSNTERLNRWSCAIRMFLRKPVFGWGPNTYMFKYAPFQLASQRTFISTDFGDLGNAHSEYLGPLCESGLLGMLSFIFIVFLSIYKGMQLYYNSSDRRVKILSLITLLGLITYFTHGLLNNYLDTDKASVPFWGYLAMLTAFDLYYKNDEKIQT